MTTGLVGGEDRHASWLELFFDLVAVAGIGMLAHLLEEDDSAGTLAIYVIAFAAIWMIWACFTIYGNLAAERTGPMMMLLGMFVLGVMTAAVPEIHGEHATAFAVAYVVGRMLASRPFDKTVIVVDLPVVQASFGVIPWVVSWWFHGSVQYGLWALGLTLDLLFILTLPRNRLVAETQARLARRSERHPNHNVTIEPADADVPHLSERLGLFVLIVIGEGLVQIIGGASEAEWNRALAVTGVGAFALMFGLWAVAVRFGYGGVALLPDRALSPRLSWPAHLAATLALATIAAVLGGLVTEPHADVTDHVRWLVVTAYAGYALLSAGIHLARGDRLRAASVVITLGIAATAVAVARPQAEGTVWLLAAGVLGLLLLHARSFRGHANLT